MADRVKIGKRARENEREEKKNELGEMSKYSKTGLAQKEAGVKLDHVTIRETICKYALKHRCLFFYHGGNFPLTFHCVNGIFCFL